MKHLVERMMAHRGHRGPAAQPHGPGSRGGTLERPVSVCVCLRAGAGARAGCSKAQFLWRRALLCSPVLGRSSPAHLEAGPGRPPSLTGLT